MNEGLIIIRNQYPMTKASQFAGMARIGHCIYVVDGSLWITP